MPWLYLALLAYLLNAVVFIIDKYLLHTHIQKPFSYAFGVAILSAGALFLIPFGVHWQSWNYIAEAFLCGAAFFIGLIYLYKSIKLSDVSIAATQVGAINTIFTAIFSVIILKETLGFSHNIALLFLILGIFLLSRVEKRIIVFSIISGALFGFYFVMLKLSFNLAGLINGVFWTRVGFVLAATSFLLVPDLRKEVYNTLKTTRSSHRAVFAVNKLISGAGFMLLYLAIRLGNVATINSLQGFQFLFTFLLALILGNKIYGLESELSRKALASKVAGIVSIFIGFITLFYK